MKFQTKPQIALSRIEAALEAGVARGVVRALPYAVGVQPTLSVWPPGEEPCPPRPGALWRGAKAPTRPRPRASPRFV